jgi:hypothetical protein
MSVISRSSYVSGGSVLGSWSWKLLLPVPVVGQSGTRVSVLLVPSFTRRSLSELRGVGMPAQVAARVPPTRRFVGLTSRLTSGITPGPWAAIFVTKVS